MTEKDVAGKLPVGYAKTCKDLDCRLFQEIPTELCQAKLAVDRTLSSKKGHKRFLMKSEFSSAIPDNCPMEYDKAN